MEADQSSRSTTDNQDSLRPADSRIDHALCFRNATQLRVFWPLAPRRTLILVQLILFVLPHSLGSEVISFGGSYGELVSKLGHGQKRLLSVEKLRTLPNCSRRLPNSSSQSSSPFWKAFWM